MKTPIRHLFGALALAAFATTASHGAFLVIEDYTPNAAWPDPTAVPAITPIGVSATSPQVSGSGVGADGNTLAQTFVTSSANFGGTGGFDLEAVALSYWTAGADVGTVTLGLFVVDDPQGDPLAFTTGTNLLNGGAGFTFTPTVNTGGSGADEDVIVFNFTDGDIVTLADDTNYAFTITGADGVSFAWGREGTGGSLGGEGYVNSNPIAGAGPRDFKFALYDQNIPNPIPEPASGALLAAGFGLLLLRRRQA